jgi:hypothetical protein
MARASHRDVIDNSRHALKRNAANKDETHAGKRMSRGLFQDQKISDLAVHETFPFQGIA